VALADVEGLLKAFSRSSKGHRIKPDEILEKILTAFGVNDTYITTELQNRAAAALNVLHLDTFVMFFSQFTDYANYYNLEDVTVLGEQYVNSRDEVDFFSFSQALVRVRRDRNMRANANFLGIQSNMYMGGAPGA
jgi:hypothetical protein